MDRLQKGAYIIAGMVIMAVFSSGVLPAVAALLERQITVHTGLTIFVEGVEFKPTDANGDAVEAFIHNGTTYLPVRAVGEALGRSVSWDGDNHYVYINAAAGALPSRGTDASRLEGLPPTLEEETAPAQPVIAAPDDSLSFTAAEIETMTILGPSRLSADQLTALAQKNNPDAPDVAALYIEIGNIYGIRGDIAFCQAAKETGWWKYGGLVVQQQHNYCGLYATGNAIVGDESLYGADPALVSLIPGTHGAWFATPAAGVEAHIQHLYAYACDDPVPAGRKLIDPRFTLVTRAIAPLWCDLGGRWAVPGYDRALYGSYEDAYDAGRTYGHSIISDYYLQAAR
ncbi:MAG: glucosaminidase domain-containing protein [Syntrophomonadaceae bacterium]|nr:glucosaminidase domain-containing protein [Syntrophomonadaceae bacterium]